MEFTLENIVIGALIVGIIYLLFKRNTEGFGMKQYEKSYYDELCKKSTERNENVNKYLGEECACERDVKGNFRNAINNRSWCHLKREEEIVTDINKDSWCGLSNNYKEMANIEGLNNDKLYSNLE